MPTVAELSTPYANHLLPVLGRGPGVCDCCHSRAGGRYALCYQCSATQDALEVTSVAVGFSALAVKSGQLARELWLYKSGATSDIRRGPRLGLAALLWRTLVAHERCLATAAGVTEFAVVTTVPCRLGRPTDPMVALAAMIGPTRERYRKLLTPTGTGTGGREPSAERYRAIAPPADAAVLLLDDTWTSGAHAQSAAAALRAAGAPIVAVWAIGRHFSLENSTGYRPAAQAYYGRARRLGWSWQYCCHCDDRL